MAFFDTVNKNKWKELGESFDLFKPSPLTATEIRNSLLNGNSKKESHVTIMQDRPPSIA